jgi:hypothetical protein
MITLENRKVGDEVALRSTGARKNRIYRITTITKITKVQIVTPEGRYWKDTGRPVGMSGHGTLEALTPGQIKEWRASQAAEEAARAEREKKYNPADNDDHVQAALRSMRDKARSLCEKLQDEVDANLSRDPGGAMMPHWWAEYLQMLVNIEESESALKSVGLSTTLKPAAKQSSLFR